MNNIINTMNTDLHTLTLVPNKEMNVYFNSGNYICTITKIEILPNSNQVNSKLACLLHCISLDGTKKVSATIDKFSTLSVEL